MKKIWFVVLLLPVLFLSACSCSAERAAVQRLEGQHEKLFVKYSAYVAQDAKLDSAAKDDELKLLQSIRDITGALRKSLEKE